MKNSISRISLGAAAALLAFGGLTHARAFDTASSIVQSSNVPAFYANVFKAFWLMDSATLLLLAAVLGLVAAKPSTASRAVILLLALMPATTAALLYMFLGAFVPAHLLLAAAVIAISSQYIRGAPSQ
jgi:hypothetical protein